jgi:CRP-like cAMP-binding protein
MVPRRAAPGEVLGRQGEPGEDFWLLLEGRVEVSLHTAHGDRRLAEAGAGSILGELALLRGRPRSATVAALEPSFYLCGGHDAMELLLAIAPVRTRIHRTARLRLAQDARPIKVALRDGTPAILRPLLPSDRQALDDALHRLSRQSIRRRFFSESLPSERLVDYLVDIDYVDHFAWVVLDPAGQGGVAVGRYVRTPGAARAEMAFTTAESWQGRGAGTLLLGALGAAAVEAGIAELSAYVLEENAAMRAVFRKAGGVTTYDDPGVLYVAVEPERAAGFLDPPVRQAIAASVPDVVTASSLALA